MNNASSQQQNSEDHNKKLQVPSSQVLSSKGSLTQVKNSKSAPKNRRLDEFDKQYMADSTPNNLESMNEMSSIKPHPDLISQIQDQQQMVHGQQSAVFVYAPMNTQEASIMQQQYKKKSVATQYFKGNEFVDQSSQYGLPNTRSQYGYSHQNTANQVQISTGKSIKNSGYIQNMFNNRPPQLNDSNDDRKPSISEEHGNEFNIDSSGRPYAALKYRKKDPQLDLDENGGDFENQACTQTQKVSIDGDSLGFQKYFQQVPSHQITKKQIYNPTNNQLGRTQQSIKTKDQTFYKLETNKQVMSFTPKWIGTSNNYDMKQSSIQLSRTAQKKKDKGSARIGYNSNNNNNLSLHGLSTSTNNNSKLINQTVFDSGRSKQTSSVQSMSGVKSKSKIGIKAQNHNQGINNTNSRQSSPHKPNRQVFIQLQQKKSMK